MKTNAVECWIGAYNVGYLLTNVDIEMLIPVSENKVIFADEKGNWFHSAVTEGVNYKSKVQNENFMTVEELEAKMSNKTTEKKMNENGFILQKPSTLKSHSKKFQPF